MIINMVMVRMMMSRMIMVMTIMIVLMMVSGKWDATALLREKSCTSLHKTYKHNPKMSPFGSLILLFSEVER